MVEEHGAEMSSRDKKDARRVNASFEFQEAGRRRGARDREAPPSSQQPPVDPPGPSASRRDRFGGHLTTGNDGNVLNSANGQVSPGPSRRQSPSPPPADMDPITAE